MILSELLEVIEPIEVIGETNKEIKGLHFDSRKIGEGDLFVAQVGTAVDGHTFIDGCVEKGAAAVVLSDRKYLPKEAKGEGLMNEGVIELPLLPNPYDRPRQMVSREHGKPALTRYIIRERRADGTIFVDFYPLTGRTHQLRVHAAHPEGLNAPIIGDRLYGNGTEESDRLMLHAAEIRFVHPVTKEEMHFCIPSNF